MLMPKKGSRFIKKAIAQVLHDNLSQRLPQLQSFEEAAELESKLYTLRTEGILNDAECNQYLEQIKEICKENNWAMP